MKYTVGSFSMAKGTRVFHHRYGVATLDGNSFGKSGDDNQYYLRISIASKIEELKEEVHRIDLADSDVDGFQGFISAIKAGKQNF